MVGIVMADVMGDAYVAHLVLKQHEAYPGQVQSIVYMCRFLSEMVGYWCGALLSNQSNWGVGLSMRELFFFLALLPIFTVVPCIVKLREDTYASHDVPPLRSQLDSLWLMLQRRATWQSVCFLAFFNALLLRNSAWGNYLTVAYHFNAFEYGSMSAIGSSVTFLAIYLYRHYIMLAFENPWHQVYIITGCVVAAFSLLNVLLVFKGNEVLGIPAFWFAVGDSAVISFAKGFQYLPLAIIFVAVCPPNQEGVAFALLTSVTNLAHAFAYTISNMMLRIWPVELTDLKQGHFNGVWKLTLLTSLVALFPLLFIGKLLPRGKGELEAMKAELSVYGARFVALLYVVGFIWVMLLSLLAIVRPCHVLVGGHGCAD
ncbi:TPA: hypothetical protein N0F65_012311 [Lagenidium giganteum]|uniref:Uncharacterized protein n=1 Tax=Lagenidium giganteum TaxID=4803 RepID=A0AAV2YVY8_9STRA|nr:TPA: hypothetical protein N0F65_012311 [Lagenidium giganteum]